MKSYYYFVSYLLYTIYKKVKCSDFLKDSNNFKNWDIPKFHISKKSTIIKSSLSKPILSERIGMIINHGIDE